MEHPPPCRLVLAGMLLLATLQAEPVEIHGIPMVRIPAGRFIMGTTPEDRRELERRQWWNRFLGVEEPAHVVIISRPLLLSRTEITQSQWQAIMGKRHEAATGEDPDLPVNGMSFHDAQAFLVALNARGPEHFRLPTEAEWEYACRAGGWGLYFIGTDGHPVDQADLGDHCWMRDNSGGRPREAATRLPNAWGLHDMTGNLWEWCSDRYHRDAYQGRGAVTRDPHEESPFPERVMRGGSWFLEARYQRSALRSGRREEDRSPHAGLRVVCEIEEEAP